MNSQLKSVISKLPIKQIIRQNFVWQMKALIMLINESLKLLLFLGDFKSTQLSGSGQTKIRTQKCSHYFDFYEIVLDVFIAQYNLTSKKVCLFIFCFWDKAESQSLHLKDEFLYELNQNAFSVLRKTYIANATFECFNKILLCKKLKSQ